MNSAFYEIIETVDQLGNVPREECCVMANAVSLLSRDKFYSGQPVIPDGWNIIFLDVISDEKIIDACKGADALFVPGSAGAITAFVLENIPSIKIIQTMGVGYDHLDIPAATRLQIPVANVPGANASSVAEHTIGGLIALQRRFLESDAAITAGNYLSFRNRALGEGLREIRGSKIGLVGFGNIARQVAKIAITLGASVSYFAAHRQPSAVESQFPVEYEPLETLLTTSDVVSLHVPLTDQTRNLIGARELALMPPGSILINTARGEIVDQAALAEALENGRLLGAAVDAFAPEPPDPQHPLLNLSPAAANRLLLTPHTAGVTLGAYKRMIETAFANMTRAVRGENPENIVNGIAKRPRP